ncbi:MAG: hypothetical protein A3B13_02240 [Candidatus Liptonbacteria bacterium RIFCSPLOWO2_01_FULL_45_15]|uniref:Killer suppression protein HigA n=1 Tax=Candidatus Liptonbacteria bacterium RIFCSPLOWO2_01_FULL_45_15 TaxID=1798649 RepID=A0A1G2CCX6_9BACT|nr:MAG: hypothetical protein A3B13_02240 [Candidatus Liptonbacteria bacterium RIFCSPLOWO2_01_FULL_45_15]
MEISFKNQRAKEFYQSESALTGKYGVQMARKIGQRISELQAARTPQQLPRGARFHEHSGRREELFSVDLVHPRRLIVLPTCSYESWVEITSVQIYEVMDPH